jgi:hypothetical protein
MKPANTPMINAGVRKYQAIKFCAVASIFVGAQDGTFWASPF